jgi:hypothetical protein
MNNNNNRPLGWTTLEESQKLVEAGLPVETADMRYSFIGEHIKEATENDYLLHTGSVDKNSYTFKHKFLVPCWSLGALLELIPAEITYSDFKPFKLGIFKDEDKCHYFIQYYPLYEDGVFCEANGHTLIEASINMILYLLNNKFIKYE